MIDMAVGGINASIWLLFVSLRRRNIVRNQMRRRGAARTHLISIIPAGGFLRLISRFAAASTQNKL